MIDEKTQEGDGKERKRAKQQKAGRLWGARLFGSFVYACSSARACLPQGLDSQSSLDTGSQQLA